MPQRIVNRKTQLFVSSSFANKKVKCHQFSRPIWTPLLYALLIIGVSTPGKPKHRRSPALIKNAMKYILNIIWNLILFTSLVLNGYESAITLHKRHIMLLFNTLLLILMRFAVQVKLRVVVKNFETLDGYLLTGYINSRWKKGLKMWVWAWSFLVFVYGIACMVKMWIITDISGAKTESLAWNDISMHMKEWPLLVKTVNVLFCILLSSRAAVANYASTVTALLFCFTFKMEQRIVQSTKFRIDKVLKRDLSNETFADIAQEINKATSLLQSVNESLSVVIFILICYWLSSIFFCLTNILSDDNLYQSETQTQLYISCVVIIFYAMFAYLAHLASKVKQEYRDLKSCILVAMESDSKLFEDEFFAANYELLGRIHDRLGTKSSIMPLELFTLDAKLIHTVLGAIITYGVIISQSLGN
ncbi:hypothetical protein AVEN_1238-1 [Araneus ventricosus]|uniref:Gustatory receptor n=1 Tax=Araneus ventricosus TaxID=182803 RepID=A0A4Y2K4D4_ARAVE|nr:hypothetical protein AVEN_1238-1 [Araneus ventricosus]